MPSNGDIPFSLRGLDHIVLAVEDVERSVAFYTRVFGASEERRIESLGMAQMRIGRSLIDIVPIGDVPHDISAPNIAKNMEHFAIAITPFDEEKIRAHLTVHDIASDRAKRRYGSEGFGPSIYIEDPDGNIVELKGPPEAGA